MQVAKQKDEIFASLKVYSKHREHPLVQQVLHAVLKCIESSAGVPELTCMNSD